LNQDVGDGFEIEGIELVRDEAFRSSNVLDLRLLKCGRREMRIQGDLNLGKMYSSEITFLLSLSLKSGPPLDIPNS